MVRSSIACARCRRSKVKCVNSICRACQQSNRECTYPSPGSTSTLRRSDVNVIIKQEGESDNKKRIRRHEDFSRRNSIRGEDPLESAVLTKKIWDDLYEIFKLHFSTEMPFLHMPTLKNRMRQASTPRESSASLMIDSQNWRVLKLGVLTLTARFNSELINHHSPPGMRDPLAASEYYASHLTASLFGPSGPDVANPSLERIQALLMLGLFEWGQSRGLSAWVYIGIAMRLAQAIGLAYEDDPSKSVFKPNRGQYSFRQLLSHDEAIQKEVRRRTMWSCYIMDRMLASGRYRPSMIQVDKLRVQLPCSDDQFLFIEQVETGFLGEPLRPEAMKDEGVLSRYIRLVDIFGRFSEWSHGGGRRTEQHPPWDQRTAFYRLQEQLKDWHKTLPSHLKLTSANLSAHLEKRNATTYASMHCLYSLCLIMLHREYVPFIALRCDGPEGPLDEPTFPKDKFDTPPGFWEASAEKIFKAGRDIVDIVVTCQENNSLPESPQMGFAVWQAEFVRVYAIHFKQMDKEDHMKFTEGSLLKIMADMEPKLKMMSNYYKMAKKMVRFYNNRKKELDHSYRGKVTHWSGGGLELYKPYEMLLKDYGSLEDDRTLGSGESDIGDYSRASTRDPAPSNGTNGDAMHGIEPTGSLPHAWAAVNHGSTPSTEPEDRHRRYSNGPYPYHNSNYQSSPGQVSNPPSLISQSNGDSSGLNSPYANTSANQSFQSVNNNTSSQIHTYPPVPPNSQSTSMPPPNHPPYTLYQNAAPEASMAENPQYDQWIGGLENIKIAGMDNMAQVNYETWSPHGWESMAGHSPSATGPLYFHLLSHPAHPAPASYVQ